MSGRTLTCPRCNGTSVSEEQYDLTCRECGFQFTPKTHRVLLVEAPNGEAIALPVEVTTVTAQAGRISVELRGSVLTSREADLWAAGRAVEQAHRAGHGVLLSAVNNTPPEPPTASDTKAGEETAKRIGRPRKGETDKERLVIGALAAHHKVEGRSVMNPVPAKTAQLAKLASGKHGKVSVATVSRFFQKKFPGRGYKGYKNACVRGEITELLALWQGDVSQYLADLRPEEYGRGKNDD